VQISGILPSNAMAAAAMKKIYWGMIGAVLGGSTFLAYLFTYMLCSTTFLGQCLGMIGAVSIF
jgi:uncharacterized membrane protein (DUF106 family)